MYRISASRAWRAAVVAAALAFLLPSGARAEQIKLNVGLSHPFLEAGKKQTAYLKVAMTGFEMASKERRIPTNVAIVLDKSGSMSGEKIRKARDAAIEFVDRLAPSDIVSVVAYDSTVSVLVPATRVSTDKSSIIAGIRRLEAGGNTALFGGVSKGAAEVRKFLDREYVNRVVLLSDGLANVGPSSPEDLAQLGTSLIKEGVSVTTLGLGSGYNEDLMTQLAMRSDGNHAFVQTADDLARFFSLEFGAVRDIVAQEVVVKIVCADGVRPVRVLGRDADITGQTVVSSLNQLYSSQERYVLLEIEVPETPDNEVREVATVNVSYANMATKTTDLLASTVSARSTKDRTKVETKADAAVMSSAVEQIATLNNDRAVTLRDQGKSEEARQLLLYNGQYCKDNAKKYNSKELDRMNSLNLGDAENLSPEKWQQRRKEMRDEQAEYRYQMRY